ncbi:tetratricopeptide repeat protein [Entomobacter blattae]|uniref:Tetratricopeptide repeat protein n=1 Tax=Entomobacter blattae TaxID=2762277 RepID=A0A7H1NP26_9PROT|nr:hypothetical protein [Entomobacter blattae]QNT77536.1 hypothetical protein JGUZn3_02780 [Entomobacter blattae]
MVVRLSRIGCLALSVMMFESTMVAYHQPAIAEVLTDSVGKKLQQAQQALNAHQYERAQMLVRSAMATSGRTDYDIYTILQMQSAVATASGNLRDTLVANNQLLNFKLTSPQKKIDILLAESTMAYRAKDYAQAVQSIKKYFAAGGHHPYMQTLLVQSYLLQKDYRNTLREQQLQIDQEKKAGQIPAESQFQVLATCFQALKNRNGLIGAYTQLVTYYPKAEYWQQLIYLQLDRNKIPAGLEFDKYFLLYQTGLLKTAADYMEAAEVAVQTDLPSFAETLIANGYQKGILGQGPESTRQKRLSTFVTQKAQKMKDQWRNVDLSNTEKYNGDVLVQAGLNLVFAGQSDKGLALMGQGQKQGVKDPNLALLRLGLAYFIAGKRDQAARELQKISGNTVLAQMARLWRLVIIQKK